MKKTQLTRRTLIQRTPLFLAGIFLLGNSALAKGGGGGGRSSESATTSGPPGSCRDWSDRDEDGCCDLSRKCDKTKCPAHEDNPRRKKKAPKGTCALWKDPDDTGECEVSTREERPCPCTTCPANCRSES